MKEDQWQIKGEELLSDKVANTLRTLIVNQTLKPGSRLIQGELSERIGVSRMPLRDALKKLAHEGLVELDPRRGASVVRMTAESFKEAYTLRAMLEPMANIISAKLFDKEDLKKLEAVVSDMDRCVSANQNREFSELNRDFHNALKAKLTWQQLNRFIDMLWNGFPPYTPAIIDGQAEISQKEHKQMFEAIKSKDWEFLETTLRYHIERSRDSLLEHLQKNNYFDNNLDE